MMASLLTLVCAVLAQGVVTEASAQGVSSAQANLDARARARAPLVDPDVAAREALLSGRNDVVLLTRPPLFTVLASVDTSSSSNAFMRPSDAVADVSTNTDLGVQIATRIASRFDVSASVTASNQTYSKYSELDYSSLQASIGVSTRLKGFDIEARYAPSRIYDSQFKKAQLTQHNTQISVAYPMQFKDVSLVPSLFASRSKSDPEDYTNTAFGADVSVSRRVRASWPVTAFAAIGYQERSYDAYFPDLLGVERKDRLTRGSIGLDIALGRFGNLTLQYSGQQNRSTSDVNGFSASSGGVSFRLRQRF
jgi:hypothetical protein